MPVAGELKEMPMAFVFHHILRHYHSGERQDAIDIDAGRVGGCGIADDRVVAERHRGRSGWGCMVVHGHTRKPIADEQVAVVLHARTARVHTDAGTTSVVGAVVAGLVATA